MTQKAKQIKKMKIHSVIRKGDSHPVFCEDFTVQIDHGRFFIGAVLDGCSSGRESHFASALYGKILRLVTQEGYIFGNSIEEKGKHLVKEFVNKLVDTKITLELEIGDLLSTFLLLMYDKVHGEALVLSVGDGVIMCDGKAVVLENERFKFSDPSRYKDMPDYISYDIVELALDKTVFDWWYANRVRKFKFDNPSDISISSDGILTFTNAEEDFDPIHYLLIDNTWENNKIMLSKKVNIIRTKYKSIHKDDLSVIRLIINSEQNDNSDNKDGEG